MERVLRVNMNMTYRYPSCTSACCSSESITNINLLPALVLEHILSYLDGDSLQTAEVVCKLWQSGIISGNLWKKLITYNTKTISTWNILGKRRGWIDNLNSINLSNTYFRTLYFRVVKDLDVANKNWKLGNVRMTHIKCGSCAWCVQYDDDKIVSGH